MLFRLLLFLKLIQIKGQEGQEEQDQVNALDYILTQFLEVNFLKIKYQKYKEQINAMWYFF